MNIGHWRREYGKQALFRHWIGNTNRQTIQKRLIKCKFISIEILPTEQPNTNEVWLENRNSKSQQHVISFKKTNERTKFTNWNRNEHRINLLISFFKSHFKFVCLIDQFVLKLNDWMINIATKIINGHLTGWLAVIQFLIITDDDGPDCDYYKLTALIAIKTFSNLMFAK